MFEALRERVLTKKGWRNLCSLWDKFEYFPPAIEQPILRLDDAVSHHNLISGTRWMQSALVLPAILGELPLEAANFLDHHIPRLVHDKGPLLEPFSQFAHLVCLFFCGSLSENEAKAVEHLYREHMRTKAVWFGDFFANRPCNVSGLEIARCIRLFGSLNFQKEDLWEGVFKESKRILAHSSHKWQPLVLMNRIRFRASVELLAAGKMYQSEGRLYPSGTAWAKFFHLLPCCNPPLPNESPTPLLHGRIRHPSEAQMEARIRLLQSCGSSISPNLLHNFAYYTSLSIERKRGRKNSIRLNQIVLWTNPETSISTLTLVLSIFQPTSVASPFIEIQLLMPALDSFDNPIKSPDSSHLYRLSDARLTVPYSTIYPNVFAVPSLSAWKVYPFYLPHFIKLRDSHFQD